MAKISVKESEITILCINENDYISLTDIARYKSDDPYIVINNWMRNRNTIEYLGMWETLFNPAFKPIEFDRFKSEAGLNAFTLSPQKWISSTDAIGITTRLSSEQINQIYANEADVLNMALFGMTAKQWRDGHPDIKGNMRDYATINELICLSNLENINAIMINDNIMQAERISKLNQIAIQQMQILENIKADILIK